MQEPGRDIDDADRERVLTWLKEQASRPDNFIALRNRAMLVLDMTSALRVKELVALDVDQVLEDPSASSLGRLRSSGYVKPEQSKGRRKGPRRWTSSGPFVITKPAREALRAYLLERIKRGWLTLPCKPGTPLFVTWKRTTSARARNRAVDVPGRISKRAAQLAWTEVQTRARVAQRYRFHDIRHDALTRMADASNGNPFRVAQFGRLKDINTAQRYVHGDVGTLEDLAHMAALPNRARRRRRRRELSTPV